MNEENVKFERQTYKTGGSAVVAIPPELQEFLGLDIENKETVVMQGESGKRGKYISMWKKPAEETKTDLSEVTKQEE